MSGLTGARRLMVRATNWVGDAVMSLPALQRLRRALPDAEIVLVARPWVADLYRDQGVADRILPADPRGGRAALVSELRRERFEAALLLPNSFDSAFVAWRTGIPVRCGYARDARSILLTSAVPTPQPGEIPAHQAYYYLELLRRLKLLDALPGLEDFSLRLPPGAREAARERLRACGLACGGAVVGLNPGAAYGTAKRWLPANYAAVGRRLREEAGAELVLFGAESERPQAESIAAEIGAGAVSTAGRTTLADFLTLVPGCDLFLTNDTGTMHVAAAAGVPVVAVFGSTDEKATAPLGRRVRIVKKPVSCSPCLLRHCPVDHRCMRDISVSEVFEAAWQNVRPSSSIVTAP